MQCRLHTASRVAALSLATSIGAIGCSSSSDSTPKAEAPCTAALEGDGAHDLALRGDGSCAATVRLGLRVATGDAAKPSWSDAASAPLKVEGAWRAVIGGFARDVVVHNTGIAPVTLVGLEWASDGLSLDADRLLHDGYQSWSYTGIERIPESVDEDRGTAAFGGEEDVLGETHGISWWWTAVMNASGRGLVLGADGGTVLKTFFAAEHGSVRIVQGMTGAGITLEPGASRALDGLFVALGDVAPALDAYAAHVVAAHPPASQPGKGTPLRGWGSWNLYYAAPTADLIQQEAAWASKTLAPLGLGDLLLDDGYEPHWGAWSAKPEFGADLGSLTSSLTSESLRPAVWLAPFLVDEVDPVVEDHPDWFLHDADGSLHGFTNVGGPTYAVLDMTVPAARDFLKSALASLAASGFVSLKLDFLFAGALDGVRSEPVTGLEAFSLGMKTIREVVPDLHLVGCGAPMLPSVGWFDSMRVGPDIAFAPVPEPQYRFGAAEARHTILRSFTDAFWSLDPDVLLLRGTQIDDAEAWTTTVATALAGGNYLLGDGRQASPARLAMALDPIVLSIARDGNAARPLDLGASVDARVYGSPILDFGGETEPPHVWRKDAGDGTRVVAAFAWNTDGYAAALDLPAGAEEILPPTGSGPSSTKPAGDTSHVAVPLHGVRVFRHQRAK